MYNQLEKCDSTTEYLQFNNHECLGKVVKIYDGDTVDICLPLPDTSLSHIYKFRCRLDRYDSPEKRSKNPIEKEYAQKATDVLTDLILNKVVKVICIKYDKYGRILCDIYHQKEDLTSVNVNQYMIDHHFGIPYNGRKKPDFQEYYDKGYFTQSNH